MLIRESVVEQTNEELLTQLLLTKFDDNKADLLATQPSAWLKSFASNESEFCTQNTRLLLKMEWHRV